MKIAELRALTNEELIVKEKAIKSDLAKLNLQRYSGKVEKPHMFGVLKRDIARIRTIINTRKV